MRQVKAMLMCLGVVFLATGAGHAQPPDRAGTTELCGAIVGTVVLTQNTELTCDVRCQNAFGVPCIQFGADHIWLRLNGLKITGPAEPPTGCNPTPGTARGWDFHERF